jgi:hypothetical protein
MGQSSHSKESTIGKLYKCPNCQKTFPSETLTKEVNQHMVSCSNISQTKTSFLSNLFGKNSINDSKIKDYIKKHKIDWTDGCDNIELSRENCLEESVEKIEFVDIWRELKISFNGEIASDAGGLYREWFTILIEELEKKEKKLFERSECDEINYIFNKNLNENSNWSFRYFNFLGRLIAKSLIDNITINLCFNCLIYKLILGEKIIFEDLKNIDTNLYTSLLSMKNMKPEELDSMEIYYSIQYQNDEGQVITEELIPGGNNKKVTDINDYIEKRINHLVSKSQILIYHIQEGLFSFIPKEILCSINSSEFELLVCGQPFIDVNDWNKNSVYKGDYNKNHKLVKWFWDEVYKLSQEDLRKLLQFSTGTSRVPINGFKKLESNRGEIAKFCLNSVVYNENNKNNYIRAHTCFNRLDVPIFPNQEELHEAIIFVIKNNTGFGID